jgi:hypothetical protein
VADAVDRIDENACTAEQLQIFVEYLPTKEEADRWKRTCWKVDAAEKFEGLCECEKFGFNDDRRYAKRKVRYFSSCNSRAASRISTTTLVAIELAMN